MEKILMDWILNGGWKILTTIFWFAIFYFSSGKIIPRLIKKTLQSSMRGKPQEEIEKRTKTLSQIFGKICGFTILILALLILLAQLGVNVTAALAGLGIVGIAVGFGAQTLIRDIISGFFILIENQYCLGDVVKIGNIMGQVEEITLRRTVLRDLDGVVHSIPNGEVRISSNWTKEFSRINFDIGVAYGEDIDRVMAVIDRVGKELAKDPHWGKFLTQPPQAVVGIEEFGDSALKIKILGEIREQPILRWDLMRELRKRLKKAFDQEGIEIPWPHLKIYYGK